MSCNNKGALAFHLQARMFYPSPREMQMSSGRVKARRLLLPVEFHLLLYSLLGTRYNLTAVARGFVVHNPGLS